MKWFFSRLVQRNTVFALGFGIPLVFFGSTTPATALVLGIAVLYIVPATQATYYLLELRIAKQFRIIMLLLVAALHESIFEIALHLVVPFPGSRLILFIRMVAVDAMILYPFQAAQRNGSFADRMKLAGSLVAGFLLTLALFTALRFGLNVGGFTLAMSTALGFFMLGYGKALYRFVTERTS